MYIPNIRNSLSKGVEVVMDGRYGESENDW